MSDDCLFCRIAAGEIPSTEVYSDESFYAFEDINPAAPTHLLVIPRKHVSRIEEADAGDADLLGKLLLTANRIALERGLPAEGFRLVINSGKGAGQSVFHIHLHILSGRPLGWPPG